MLNRCFFASNDFRLQDNADVIYDRLQVTSPSPINPPPPSHTTTPLLFQSLRMPNHKVHQIQHHMLLPPKILKEHVLTIVCRGASSAQSRSVKRTFRPSSGKRSRRAVSPTAPFFSVIRMRAIVMLVQITRPRCDALVKIICAGICDDAKRFVTNGGSQSVADTAGQLLPHSTPNNSYSHVPHPYVYPRSSCSADVSIASETCKYGHTLYCNKTGIPNAASVRLCSHGCAPCRSCILR